MNKVKLCAAVYLLFSSQVIFAQAMDHSGHGGGGGGGMACQKLRLNQITPAPLTEMAPGSTFTFLAFGLDKPEHMDVTVKKIPVEVTAEDKETFYKVTGQLPSELKGTAARISVKVTAKVAKCNAEDGWLVKITP
jgi:hypothetical protein